jgi:hypothetical protein
VDQTAAVACVTGAVSGEAREMTGGPRLSVSETAVAIPIWARAACWAGPAFRPGLVGLPAALFYFFEFFLFFSFLFENKNRIKVSKMQNLEYFQALQTFYRIRGKR